MIAATVWLPQILRYCRFILDDGSVKRAWIDSDLSETSVSSFDELYEQVFDDLDSDNFCFESSGIGVDQTIRIKNFIKCLHEANKVFEGNLVASEIIRSKQWGELKRSASAVLDVVD